MQKYHSLLVKKYRKCPALRVVHTQRAELAVHWKVDQVHGAGGLHRQPHRPEDLPEVGDPEELVLRRGHVEGGRLFVDEKGVGHPDELDVVGADDELVEALLQDELESEREDREREREA